MGKSARRANRAIEEIGDEAANTAGKMAVASGRVDKLGDELSDVGRQATTAAAGVSAYGGASSSAALASSGLATAMSASLIPAAITLSSIVGPLAITLGGVAAAAGSLAAGFGTVLATGFLAYGRELASTMPKVDSASKALSKRFGQLATKVRDIIAPLGRQFVPLIRDAVNSVPTLVRNIVAAIGPLDGFANTLRRMGTIAMQALPTIVGMVFDLGRAVLPVFNDIITLLRGRAASAFTFLKGVVQETWPEFKRLAGALVSAIPPFIRFGVTVTNTLVPALTAVVGIVGDAFRWFNDLPTPVQRAGAAIGALSPVIIGAVTATARLVSAVSTVSATLGGVVPAASTAAAAIGSLSAPIVAVGAAVAGLAVAFNTNFANFRTVVVNAFARIRAAFAEHRAELTTLSGVVQGFVNTIAAGFETVKRVVTGVFRFLFNNIVNPIITKISTLIAGRMGTILTEVTQTMQALKSRMDTVLDVAMGLWRRFGDEIRFVVNKVIRPVAAFFSDVIVMGMVNAVDVLVTTVTAAMDIVQGDWRAALTKMAELGKRMFARFKDLATTAFDGIVSFIKRWGPEVVSLIKQTLRDAASYVLSTGKSLVKDAFDAIIDAIKTIWNDFYDWLIGSSKVKDIIKDVKSYLTSTGKQLIKNAFGAIIGGIKTAISYLTCSGEDSLLGDAKGTVGGIASWAKNTGKSAVSTAFDEVAGAIESAFDGIDLSGISNALQDVINAAGNAIDEIENIPNNVTSMINLNIKKTFLGGNQNNNSGNNSDNDDPSGRGAGGSASIPNIDDVGDGSVESRDNRSSTNPFSDPSGDSGPDEQQERPC